MKEQKDRLREALSYYTFAKDDCSQSTPLPLDESDFYFNKGCTSVHSHIVEGDDFQEIRNSAVEIITSYKDVIDNYMLSVSYSNPALTRDEDRFFCENVIYKITEIFDDDLYQNTKIGLIINSKQRYKFKLIIHLITKGNKN